MIVDLSSLFEAASSGSHFGDDIERMGEQRAMTSGSRDK